VIQETFLKYDGAGNSGVDQAKGLSYFSAKTFPKCSSYDQLKYKLSLQGERAGEPLFFLTARSRVQVKWMLNILVYAMHLLGRYCERNYISREGRSAAELPPILQKKGRHEFLTPNTVGELDARLKIYKSMETARRAMTTYLTWKKTRGDPSNFAEDDLECNPGLETSPSPLPSPSLSAKSSKIVERASVEPAGGNGGGPVRDALNSRLAGLMEFLHGKVALRASNGNLLSAEDLLDEEQIREDLLSICCVYYATNGGIARLEAELSRHDEGSYFVDEARTLASTLPPSEASAVLLNAHALSLSKEAKSRCLSMLERSLG
jgi:hypothetical protein